MAEGRTETAPIQAPRLVTEADLQRNFADAQREMKTDGDLFQEDGTPESPWVIAINRLGYENPVVGKFVLDMAEQVADPKARRLLIMTAHAVYGGVTDALDPQKKVDYRDGSEWRVKQSTQSITSSNPQ